MEVEPDLAFFNTKLFEQTHGDAHKERTIAIDPPALTWHMAYLIPRRGRRSAQQQSHHGIRIDQREMKCVLDGLLLGVIEALESANLTFRFFPKHENSLILHSAVFDSVTKAEVERRALSRRVTGILDGDERATVLSFAWDNRRITIRVHLRTNLFTITLFADKKLFDVSDATAFEALTHGFWEQFTAFMFSHKRLRQIFEQRAFRGLFADIRGVIIPYNFDDTTEHPSDRVCAGSEWPTNYVRRLLPIATSNGKYECIASYMLDRKALHLTTLGIQPIDEPDHKRVPITFLLSLRPQSGSFQETEQAQLGRLIERMHLLGTLRLAALLDLKLLRQASVALSLIDTSKAAARNQIERFERGEIESNATRAAIENARADLNKVSTDFLKNSPAGVGLTFRIESSRYYASKYKENLPALRLHRVEGFQRYDHFVERKLGILFEFIDRLGNRYERALREMATVDQSFSSIQARNIGSSVEEIQRYGEVILLAFLVPYYLMGSVEDLFGEPEGPLM